MPLIVLAKRKRTLILKNLLANRCKWRVAALLELIYSLSDCANKKSFHFKLTQLPDGREKKPPHLVQRKLKIVNCTI